VYEMEEKLTIDIYILVIHLMQHFTIDQGALHWRIYQIVELGESRRNDFDQIVRNQDKIKGTFDHKVRQRYLEEGYLLLM